MRRNNNCSRADNGMTFIEVLVAVVLLGTAVLATLAGLQATIVASTVNRDHANAYAWLQSSADILYGTPRKDCGTPGLPDKLAVITEYRTTAQSVTNPEGWNADQIDVYDVQFWQGDRFGDDCLDNFARTMQLVRLRVVSKQGDIIKEYDIVKGADV